MELARRYHFTGLRNARDLGGYAAEGGVTRFGVFLRTDVPRGITPEDREKLRALGITVDIDLREDREARKIPDELQGEPWLTFRSMPVLGVRAAAVRDLERGHTAFDSQFFWGEEYISMLRGNHPWVREILEYLAAAEGMVMYHCFTGKDRTGILSALLLGLCGVSPEDIAADYAVSEIYLQGVYRWMTENVRDFMGQSLSSPFFSTSPRNIQAVLQVWNKDYGGVRGFAEACGTDSGAIEALQEKLIKRA